jgi:hypothetical protein
MQMMKTDSKKQVKRAADEGYDPNSETCLTDRDAALRWELLRRNDAFGKLAALWCRNPRFRLKHSETEDYHHDQVHFPRCALDWMLTGKDRAELARSQIAQGAWFADERFNFGPIRVELKVSPLLIRKDNIADCFRIGSLTGANPVLRLEQPWPATSEHFRRQFMVAISGDDQFSVLSDELKEAGRYLRWAAARFQRGDKPQAIPEIIQTLESLGERIHELAEFHHIFAVPSAHCRPDNLKQHLDAIRNYCTVAGTGNARYNAHESWLGTAQAWRWFLVAEQRGLDPKDSKQMYELAREYSESLRQARYDKTLRTGAKVEGFRGAPVSSQTLKNRRATLARFILLIRHWIEAIYPPACWLKFIGPRVR